MQFCSCPSPLDVFTEGNPFLSTHSFFLNSLLPSQVTHLAFCTFQTSVCDIRGMRKSRFPLSFISQTLATEMSLPAIYDFLLQFVKLDLGQCFGFLSC